MSQATSSLIVASALSLLLPAFNASARIAGPYVPDSSTLHLWHLNEPEVPVTDSATNRISLTSLVNGAVLATNSFLGFGTALNTYDGGPTGIIPASKDAALSALPLTNNTADNVSMSYAHAVTGAFTYEALLRIDFDPAANFGTTASGGNGRLNSMMIMAGEDDVESGRVFQFRVNPIGTITNHVSLEFININKGVSIQNLAVLIPTTGPNAIAFQNWYHVAVTYDGNAGTANNLKFFWTLMESHRTNATLIGSATMNADLAPGIAMDFAVGNTGRGMPNANFVGLIDEVRMSSVARAASEMMFAEDLPPLPPPPPAISSATYLDCLVDFERHAETIWHTATAPNTPPDSGYFGDGNDGGNGGIRGSCGVAIAYAVLVSASPNDPLRLKRLARVRQALNYAANTHFSGTNVTKNGKKWGRGWQTSLWAGSMGLACMLVENELPASTIEACQRAVADEATYRAGIPPASGYIGDSKGEENGWDANVVSLAAAWLPGNTNAALWLNSAKKYLANTYTVANTNGDPLASWITTTTLYPSFAMENHNFYHPTYQMVSGMSMGDSLLMAKLANPSVAAELQPFAEHNVLNVWGMLGKMVLDSGEFIYPSGLDWALHDYEQNSYYAWLAHHFNDPLARYADSNMVQLVRYRQIINGDGRFVGESEENGFYREAVEARRTAIAWLHQQQADFPSGPIAPPAAEISHFSDVKLITQRSPSGFVSVSYGARIMAVIEPQMESLPTNVFISTPKLAGIIGQGGLGNPISAQLVNFNTNANGFDAQLTLQHGSQGATEVYIKSTGETVAIVEVPNPFGGVTPTTAGSFTVGIENDPLTGGSQLLEWSGGSVAGVNRSGAIHNITNDWLSVSGRYGIAAGPSGYFRYQTASSYNRLGAAEDSLQFRSTNTSMPRYAVWFPGKSPAEIAASAASISWSVSSSNVVLTFPGVGGALQQITAMPPPPPPPYSPYPVSPNSVTASTFQTSYPPLNVLDGSSATFWVSSGTASGQGPTPAGPEWLDFSFARDVGVSGMIITPRINYGPKAIQISFGTNVIYSGTMSNSQFALSLSPPSITTNAHILITDSFDPSFPATPRNVQVVEVTFLERALPGTFADWALRHFSEAHLTDSSLSGSAADPDDDGVANLVEFATGGHPLIADTTSALQTFVLPEGKFVLRFNERIHLGDVARTIFSSTNLTIWNPKIPLQENAVETFGNTQKREAVFEMQNMPRFFQIGYRKEP